MNNYYKILALACVVGLSSCHMERFPKSSIAVEQSFSSVADGKNWDNGVLASLRTSTYGVFLKYQDYQADMLNASIDFGNRNGSFYNWGDLNSGAEELKTIWHAYYSRIKNVNFCLQNYNKIPVESDAEKNVINQIMGNALFARAYYYFNLAIRWGQPYKATSATTDLSVPLLITYDLNEMPPRATNAVLYKQILDDLAAAKIKLAQVKNVPMSELPNTDACLALEARVKLYMGDWAGAQAAAKALIDANRYTLVSPTAENFEQMWVHDNSTEDIFTPFISKPDELPLSTSYFGENRSLGANTPDFLPTKWVIDLYEEVDLRKAVYFSKEKLKYAGVDYPKGDLYVISKFKGNPAYSDQPKDDIWGYLPNGIHRPKLFRIAETYLIAAESAYKQNNESDAKKYLNALRASRGLKAVDSSGESLFTDIKNERTRELAFEGFRLWDLRRWGMPMKRHDPQTIAGKSPFLSPVVDINTMEISPENPKWIWGIPHNDMQTNDNLKGHQNKGW